VVVGLVEGLRRRIDSLFRCDEARAQRGNDRKRRSYHGWSSLPHELHTYD